MENIIDSMWSSAVAMSSAVGSIVTPNLPEWAADRLVKGQLDNAVASVFSTVLDPTTNQAQDVYITPSCGQLGDADWVADQPSTVLDSLNTQCDAMREQALDNAAPYVGAATLALAGLTAVWIVTSCCAYSAPDKGKKAD